MKHYQDQPAVSGVRCRFSCSLPNMGVFGEGSCCLKGFFSSTSKFAQTQKEDFLVLLPLCAAPHKISFLLMEEVLVPQCLS